jgi:predicted ATP-grasp superfamily ATP-dependent carboligase
VCGVAWNGEIVTAVHQVARRTWPPDTGVSAYAETVAPDRVLEEQVASLVRLLGWSGIFQAQFMRALDGAYFIDFNPRIYGSLALAVAAGANLPAIWVSLLTRSHVETGPYRVGVRYRSEELDTRALLHLLLSGRPLAACTGLIPRRPTTHAVANLADPLPLLTSLAKARRRLTGKARDRILAAGGPSPPALQSRGSRTDGRLREPQA